MTGPRARVLVVDDSAFSRKVLREVLARQPSLEVVGFARDGLEALEKVAELRPDVITLDLVMPHLDGLGFLLELPRLSRARVVLVTSSSEESGLVLEALELGAFDFVHKPTSLASERLYELGDELVSKVLAAARQPRDPTAELPVLTPAPSRTPVAPVVPTRPAAPDARGVPVAPVRAAPHGVELVVIGTSTGGPQALTAVIPALPADLPCAVAVALHIPAEFTPSLARRLDALSRLSVAEATDGAVLRPGEVLIAKGGLHLTVERCAGELVARLSRRPSRLHYPSVDLLFESAAAACGPAALGVVLTGMGNDGLLGARAMTQAGAAVLTEAATSAIIDGMPRAVREAGLSAREVPLGSMAAAIVDGL